ncbi:hypothetical protein RB195_014820 [Necator americanus]|uniref:Uncharacterized protein n=1 Tax=Necator americanus TaxID=51031 RepID=A0ABR1E1R3_NECAM
MLILLTISKSSLLPDTSLRSDYTGADITHLSRVYSYFSTKLSAFDNPESCHGFAYEGFGHNDSSEDFGSARSTKSNGPDAKFLEDVCGICIDPVDFLLVAT